jgi:hypothetical protein
VKICPVDAEMFHAERRTERNDEANSRLSQILETRLNTLRSVTQHNQTVKHHVYPKNEIFSDVTSCQPVNSYKRSEEFLCLRLQGVLRTKHEGTSPFRKVAK